MCAHRSPGAGEQLVGAPAEQERLGALVGQRDERPGLVIALPPGPSAALESVPAVIRRGAVSLHHSIDGDLSHGRQLHDRGSFASAPALVRGLTPATNTTAPIRHPVPDFLKNFRDGRSSSIQQHDSVAATALHLLKRAQCGQARRPVDREDPDHWWRASNSSGAWATSSVA
jgi:hypothetical protein